MHHDGVSPGGGDLALPDRSAWLAVLEVEQQRARRHGGTHGLVLIRLDGPVGRRHLEVAAAAIIGTIRDIDFLALVDRHTFAVLAIHCDDLPRLVTRLRRALDSLPLPDTLIDARPAGGDLGAVWAAMISALPFEPTSRHIDFVASSPLSLN